MKKLFLMLWNKKFLVIILLLICISRSILVLYLNSGYAKIIDNVLASHFELILNSALQLICIGVFQVIVIFTQNYISSILAEKTGYSLRKESIYGILNTDYKNIHNFSVGENLSKLNTDLTGITEWIKNELSVLISDFILFMIVLIALLNINWKLTVVSFSIVPFISIISYILSKPIIITEKEKNQTLADVNILVKSVLDAFPILKIFGMKQHLISKAESKINISVKAEQKANIIRGKLMSINGFLSYIPIAIIFGYGGLMVIKGELSVGTLLAFTNMSNFVRSPLVNLPVRVCSVRKFSVNISRVLDMLTQLRSVKRTKSRRVSNMIKENIIEFKNVYFSYSKYKNLISNVNFEVKEGSTVAIVGKSGCGKSTILKLITGLYYADKGDVIIFGENIKNTNLDIIRNNISFIPQESQLFPLSIFENITCGHSISMEKVLDACKAAGIMDFINTLSHGIYTNIGEQGNKLSGGEKQRISIARAIAKNSPLIIMDEATSALDGETEKEVLNYFNSIKKDHTIVYVTHKIKYAKNADLIICMKDGQICEYGKHEELMQADNYYSKIYKVQNLLEVL